MNGPDKSNVTRSGPARQAGSGPATQLLPPVVAAKRTGSYWRDWLPLVALPVAASVLFVRREPWLLMWAMALALYGGCKWLTGRRARNLNAAAWRNWSYLLLWPGMDAAAFLDDRRHIGKPPPIAWLAALAEASLGAFLLWGMAGRVPASQVLLRGWVGMLGVVFLLHFGLFELLALTWQRIGIDARPLMRAPIMANSLAEFWGQRWNTAFNRLAHDLVFRPLHRRIGGVPAMLAAFAVSGLVHDLLISVPARGGYGLPTAYFLLQGAGLLFERSQTGRAVGLGCGMRGRLFTVALTASPAVLLIHPPFVRNVILPMLHAIGAT